MSIVWGNGAEGFYATIIEPPGEIVLFHLVEKYNDRWDWAIWRPSQDPQTATHGLTDTAHEAIRAAELATI